MVSSRQRWIYVSALLAALAASAFFLNYYLLEKALHAMPTELRKFSLDDSLPKCARWKDHMPAKRDPAAYRLYMEARKLWRSKIEWQLSRDEATRILTDVSKAADLGDWGARALLAHFYLEGLGPLEKNEVLKPDPYKAVEIVRLAAAAMQPWGLYDLGVAYEHGYGGAHYDVDLAWAYYAKAAELGSPEAQMALAQAYSGAGRRDDEATMQRCAYEQGHGPAAHELALYARVNLKFYEAIQIYQNGVRLGSAECARDLRIMFNQGYWAKNSPKERDALSELGIQVDAERELRYNAIHEALKINPDLKLGRLDQVLPLPPATLPTWSGVEDAGEQESNDLPTY